MRRRPYTWFRNRSYLLTFAVLLHLPLCGAHAAASAGDYASHPPLRPPAEPSTRPMPGGPFYIVDARRGNDANPGTKADPWQTINHALAQLSAGDTLLLRGGSYFENVYCAVKGAPDSPITIRSYPGELAVIDGGMPEFQNAPAAAWQECPDGAPDEFVSTRTYKNIRDVTGLFGDSNNGLQTYWYRMDLQSHQRVDHRGRGDHVEARVGRPRPVV